jgi:hypothetical protein
VCGVIATGAGGVGAAEPVVCGVKKPLEHHWVRYTREVPLRVPVRGRGGSSLAEPWYDSSLVVAMRLRTASRWWSGRSSYAAVSVLADKAYTVVALRIPWGNRGSGTARSSVGVAAVSLADASRCEATRAARRRSIHA